MVGEARPRNAVRKGGTRVMSTGDQAFANSRALVWAGAAVLCGCALLMVMGAPVRMPLMNAAAFLIGLALLGIVHGARRLGAPRCTPTGS